MARLAMLVALLVTGASAQDAPQIDMTDPVAVVQAYVQACRSGDVATMLTLVLPEEAKLQQLQELAAMSAEQRDRIPGMGSYLTEMLLLPVGPDWQREVGERSGEGDEARFTFKAVPVFEGAIVLGRQEDGTWRVKLLDSLKATAQDGRSVLAAGLTGSREGGGPQQAVWESQRNLSELAQAMTQYANDHNSTLPPADQWVDELERYVLDRARFKSPAKPDLEYGYAMNEALSSRRLPDDWEERREMVLLFEWPGGERNAHAPVDDSTDLTSLHEDGSIVLATADGNATVLQAGESLAARFEAERATNACRDHLQQLVRAARKFAVDHDGLLPGADTWEEDLAPYVEPVSSRGDDRQAEWKSREKLQSLFKALKEYAQDHGALPQAERWMEELKPYVLDASAFQCPALPEAEGGYAMNEELSGQPLPQDWQQGRWMLLLFEWASAEANAHALPQQLAQAGSPHASGAVLVMDANGRVVTVPPGVTFEEVEQADDLEQTCRKHLQQLVEALRKYVREHDGTLPPAETWQDDLALYMLEVGDPIDLLLCPAAPDLDFAYAYNEEIAGKRVAELPEAGRTIVLFESDLNVRNAHEPAPKAGGGPPRHMASWNDAGGVFAHLAYLDGSVEFGAQRSGPQLRPGPLAPLLTCPAAPGVERAYAINRAVAGKKAAELTNHEQLVLFFESALNVPNAAGDPDKDAASPPRHRSPGGRTEQRYNHTGALAGYVQDAYAPTPAPAPE